MKHIQRFPGLGFVAAILRDKPRSAVIQYEDGETVSFSEDSTGVTEFNRPWIELPAFIRKSFGVLVLFLAMICTVNAETYAQYCNRRFAHKMLHPAANFLIYSTLDVCRLSNPDHSGQWACYAVPLALSVSKEVYDDLHGEPVLWSVGDLVVWDGLGLLAGHMLWDKILFTGPLRLSVQIQF